MIKSDFAYAIYEDTININNFVVRLNGDMALGDGTTRSDNGQLFFSQVGIAELQLNG